MADVELTRVPGDRRLYAIEGYGTLRFEGLASRVATAEVAGRRWRITPGRFWSRDVVATDEAGAAAGLEPGLLLFPAVRWLRRLPASRRR
jgi:hypothetical protein